MSRISSNLPAVKASRVFLKLSFDLPRERMPEGDAPINAFISSSVKPSSDIVERRLLFCSARNFSESNLTFPFSSRSIISRRGRPVASNSGAFLVADSAPCSLRRSENSLRNGPCRRRNSAKSIFSSSSSFSRSRCFLILVSISASILRPARERKPIVRCLSPSLIMLSYSLLARLKMLSLPWGILPVEIKSWNSSTVKPSVIIAIDSWNATRSIAPVSDSQSSNSYSSSADIAFLMSSSVVGG